ncbi:coiled-coil domain-containing protein 112 [Monomorium pharaonis]|uniref:coiled-coil domain-containing protein 112 n=1 Tax=Monomorium pharaonis TaxID=307658 RepID=UPI00063EF97C|nr:coiled-coil domain-containing protein 112 [Monomorium pharaonis]
MNGIIHEKDKKKKRIPSCGKVCSAESTKCRKSLLKLKQQEYLMEKSLANLMENMKLEPEVLRPVLHNMSDISKNRETFLDSIKKPLKEIIKELQSVQSVTNCPKQIQKLDTNAYKQRLERLSQKIRDFQESSQLQAATLSQEQTALESELREFESNLHKYENATGSIGKPTSAASSNKENKKCYDYKEIEDFHELIAKTGHTDNWSDGDHLLFLKMRKKCSNIPALVTAIRVKCPDLTAETIVNHEAWYKVYLSLREKQRSSVKEWRKQKETEKMKMKNREDETGAKTTEEISREERNSNITKDLSTCVKDKCEGRITKTGNSDDISNQKKELIRQWKTEKERKRLMDEEQLKILMKSKLAAQEKRKRERLKRLREVLGERCERKSMVVPSETSKNDSRTGPKYNPMLIKAFRQQDAEYTRRQKNLIAKQRLIKNQTVKIARSQISTKQDHSTLLNSTEVWREKCRKHDPNTREPKKLQYIKDVPRLHIHWRNKESMEIKDALSFS